MTPTDRRTFLKLLGTPALAASFPSNIAQAMDIPARNRHQSIHDVEHIVILTQENRSFDHHFGTLRGVRGFADPRAVVLRSGKTVWHQPNGTAEVLPFRPDVPSVGNMYLPDPPHGWNDTHAAWNRGEHDRWVPNKGIAAMTYHKRRDLPYHFALADAFTVCDAYHCSLMGPTDPNRYHMWTGWVGNDGNGGGPVITNAELGYDWSSYPERLQRAGISWKVYQDTGVGLDAAGFWGWTDDPFIGNYGDNSLLYLHQYQNAQAGTPLANGAKTGTTIRTLNRAPERLFDIFREDVRMGRLPKVSWIAAPEAYTEHPNWPANIGAWYISQILDILVSNPAVFSKTVFIINYDEEGGFFDHMVPPTPPQTRAQGLSTVDTRLEIYPGDASHPSAPYGLGMRVPLLIISPWTKGGWVNSELFDATSLIKFLEARFADDNPDLVESNITPWRRAIVGDLTSAFDFKNPNHSTRIFLPPTTAYKPTNLVRVADETPVVPAGQTVPKQEVGVRPARALPYTLHATAAVTNTGLTIGFDNMGSAGAVFLARSANPADVPRSYTVESGKQLRDSWATTGDYDVTVGAPNGFFRRFKGSVASGRPRLEVRVGYDCVEDMKIVLAFANRGASAVTVRAVSQYSGRAVEFRLAPGQRADRRWSSERFGGWYDVVVTVAEDPDFLYQVAGHVENGRDSISDPLMGGMI